MIQCQIVLFNHWQGVRIHRFGFSLPLSTKLLENVATFTPILPHLTNRCLPFNSVNALHTWTFEWRIQRYTKPWLTTVLLITTTVKWRHKPAGSSAYSKFRRSKQKDHYFHLLFNTVLSNSSDFHVRQGDEARPTCHSWNESSRTFHSESWAKNSVSARLPSQLPSHKGTAQRSRDASPRHQSSVLPTLKFRKRRTSFVPFFHHCKGFFWISKGICGNKKKRELEKYETNLLQNSLFLVDCIFIKTFFIFQEITAKEPRVSDAVFNFSPNTAVQVHKPHQPDITITWWQHAASIRVLFNERKILFFLLQNAETSRRSQKYRRKLSSNLPHIQMNLLNVFHSLDAKYNPCTEKRTRIQLQLLCTFLAAFLSTKIQVIFGKKDLRLKVRSEQVRNSNFTDFGDQWLLLISCNWLFCHHNFGILMTFEHNPFHHSEPFASDSEHYNFGSVSQLCSCHFCRLAVWMRQKRFLGADSPFATSRAACLLSFQTWKMQREGKLTAAKVFLWFFFSLSLLCAHLCRFQSQWWRNGHVAVTFKLCSQRRVKLQVGHQIVGWPRITRNSIVSDINFTQLRLPNWQSFQGKRWQVLAQTADHDLFILIKAPWQEKVATLGSNPSHVSYDNLTIILFFWMRHKCINHTRDWWAATWVSSC